MKKAKRRPRPSIKPQHLRGKDAWFYLEPKGLTVVAELRPKGIYQGTTVVTIPWSRLRRPLQSQEPVK